MTLTMEEHLWHTAYVGVTHQLKTDLTVSIARIRLNGGTIKT